MKTIRQLIDLSDRVAVVTGGAGHVGQALCDTLAELGAAVVVLDRGEQACQQVANQLTSDHQREAMPLPVDLTDQEQLGGVCQRVLREFDRIDILVNCAAFVGTSELEGWATEFARQRADVFRQAMDLNLVAPFALTQSCAEALARSGHGSVINIGSIYGLVGPDPRLYEGSGLGNPAAYAASKAGLMQLTRWLATTMAPSVRVNSITPGGIFRNQEEEFVRRYSDRTPLRRMGSEQDIKGALAYLAGDLSQYVTGHDLVVDGGWTAW